MIQRYIHELLTTGFAAYKADPDLLDDLFLDNYGLNSAETSAIKQYFITHTPDVVNGYPRTTTTYPAVAIVLIRENEVENFIGNDVGQETEEGSSLFGADVEGAVWEYVFNLLIFAEHNPDVTSYYYEITKSILLAGLETLDAKGCMVYRMSGADLAPDPRYIPEHLFGRRLELSCQREFQYINRISRLTKAFQVAGIHIDKSGSPSDVGEVETLVTPYSEDGAND